MATGFNVLSKGTFSGNQTSITFSNIDQSYSHLQFEITARGSQNQNRVFLNININGVNTGSKYMLLGWQQEGGSGSALANDGVSDAYWMAIPGDSVQANQLGAVEMLIPNYSGAIFNKAAMGRSSSADSSNSNTLKRYADLVYEDKAAVTSVTFHTAGVGYIFDCGSYIMGAWK